VRDNVVEYTLEELLLTAIKSEEESRKAYLEVSGRVKNKLISERLKFMAMEELNHKAILETIYGNYFPGKTLVMPEKTPVPVPEIMYQEGTEFSEILKSAMEAELSAHDFYLSLSERVDDEDVKKALIYLSEMEMGHYRMLEMEQKIAERDEYYYNSEFPIKYHIG